MKNALIISVIILLGLSFFSCNSFDSSEPEQLSIENDFKSIEVNNEYKISVPKYMKEAKDLSDEASLQYQNIFKETYFVILDESKEEMISIFQELGEYNNDISVIKNYRDIQLQYLADGMDVRGKSEPKSIQIGGLDAETMEFGGNVDDVIYDIAYFVAFIEGKEKVYMLTAWTLESRKKKYKSTFEKILNSFELIEN